ncbi:MAG: hypothetical protein QF878_14445 [SAR202 cluster bacterium]|nr:hypothetical protein [SAR202 cluster bacterium]
MLFLGAGCWWLDDDTPPPDPTPSAATPGASGSPSPTFVPVAPQPVPLSSVITEHLPGMALTQPDIDAEFSNLVLTGDGYLSPDDVSKHTIDPDDTASDLESRGFLDGFENMFQDLSNPFSVTVSADVYRWDTSKSAEQFIRTEVSDSRRLNGAALQEGIVLTQYEELEPPSIGTNAIASRQTLKIDTFDSEVNVTSALWQRENIVASVRALVSIDMETAGSVNQLAARMNERIDDVLAGRIPVVLVPTPQPTPIPDPLQEQRLASMLLELGDLPSGAAIRQEGPLDVSGASGSYQRRFMPQATTFDLGNSEITEIQVTVGQFTDAETAKVPVEVLRSLGPEGAGQLITQGFVGSTADTIGVDLLDFPTIGDDSYSLLLHMKTAVADLEGYLVYFARGTIRAQFVVFGLDGKLSMEDVIPLARLFDQRIQAAAP